MALEGGKSRKRLVQILSMFFGFGSWIAMTGLWVELPLLTQKLPESWSLGSYLTVMIQLANVGPLIYWFLRARKLCSEVVAIHVQMFIGTLACLALIFWWDVTLVIFGVQRSIVLYLAAFGLSIVDCTSSVVFLPYMARFKAHHMTPYLIGEGLSGFLPSLVALAQGLTEEEPQVCPASVNHTLQVSQSGVPGSLTGSGRQPRFSANIFFCFLLLILLLSWLAFTLMDVLDLCRDERIDLGDVTLGTLGKATLGEGQEDLELSKMIEDEQKVDVEVRTATQGRPSRKLVWLLGLMCWGCFTTFGAMPSIQSYSCLPYGAETFFYAVTLAGVAYPAACVLGLFVDIRMPNVINTLTLIGSCIGMYILICGILSPNPPMKQDTIGGVVMILSWTFYVGIISYMKTMVSLEINETSGNQGMFYCGIAQQFGAATGGALIFCIINFTNVFNEENKCV